MGKLKLNAKKGKDRKKDGGKTKGAITRIQTRKEKRKNEREQKKKRKETFFKKKYGKMTPAPLEEKVKKEQNGVGNKRKEEEDKATKEEKKRKKREREEKKVRKLNLRRDNEAEEKTIRQLEKQLGIKKKKSKEGKLPKSFIEDGLDFLMEVCDPDKMKLLQEGGDADEFDEEEDGFLKELQGDDDEDSEDQPEDDDDSDAVDGEMGEEGDVADSEGEEKEDMEDGRDMDNDDSEEEEEEEEDESDDELEEEEISDSESNTGKVWEDIYGRTRDAKGKVVNGTSSKSTSAPTEGGSKYVPPALRAKMLGGHDEKRREEMLRLQRKVKGLLNRLAASNMSGIAKELEGLYASHSRNDMNECLSKLFFDSLISPALAPERLVMEHALLIGVLHCNVGVEVGATMLQVMVKKFHQSYLDYAAPDDTQQNSDKTLENYALVISHLYTFKVTNCDLIYDMLDMLVDTFEAKDVEIVMLLLKTVGFGLRKDDPEKLKKLIVRIQQKSTDATHLEKDSRIKFMLEVLLAIKNNNVKKIPNYDPEHQLFLLKNMKQWLRPGASTNPFTIRMEDLLRAEERGRWWIVGSAWSGKADYSDPSEAPAAMLKTADFSTELLDLARKMRMNTDARKSIFCTVMSAEDYLDAFEKLVKLNVRAQKEREVAFVLLDCCLQEQRFNPYYAQLTAKLSSFDRKYRMAAQFAIWDKIKVLHDLKKFQRDNLSGFTCFLIREETLSIACLKVIEFADLDKIYVAFLKRVLTDLLAVDDAGSCKKIFSAVAGYSKLRTLREGLRLFMRHFMLKGKSDEGEREALEKRVELAEAAFMSSTERQLEL